MALLSLSPFFFIELLRRVASSMYSLTSTMRPRPHIVAVCHCSAEVEGKTERGGLEADILALKHVSRIFGHCIVWDRKRFFAETPKPKIVVGKCQNSSDSEILSLIEFSAKNVFFWYQFLDQIRGSWYNVVAMSENSTDML